MCEDVISTCSKVDSSATEVILRWDAYFIHKGFVVEHVVG